MIAVFLAEGFEEIEAVATIDILRRAGLDVKTVGIGGTSVLGAHGMRIEADLDEHELRSDNLRAVVLPGGGVGTHNLDGSDTVKKTVAAVAKRGGGIFAICAAPGVLGHIGVLKGKRATCYPGCEENLTGAQFVQESVVEDSNIITANGPGASLEFGLRIVSKLVSEEKSGQIRSSMQCR